MCNCGSKRNTLVNNNYKENVTAPVTQARTNFVRGASSVFKYIGKTALTVTGNVTGRSYRFYAPGDVQSVDSRDTAGMLTLPVLRQIV